MPPRKLRLSHALATGSFFGLAALQVAWHGLLLPAPGSLQLLLPALALAPFALFLGGILRARPRSYAGFGFVVLLYFVHGCYALTGGGLATRLGAVEIFLSLTYVFSGAFFARWRSQAATPADS
jgi:uncharacterized membrane protein